MAKKPLFMLCVGASTAIAALILLKSRTSSAKKVESGHRAIKSVIVIGDSQTKRHLGDAYTSVFGEDGIDVRYFGKEGKTHVDYLKDPSLKQELRNLGCADIVVIQLGDNGISSNISKIRDFADLVQAQCPHSDIYWGGPMKAVRPTINSNYVRDDPESPRYLPTYNKTIRIWDSRLKDALASKNVTYVSNYHLQERQPRNSAFSDSRGGDGIHLTKESALTLARLMREIITSGGYNGQEG